MKKTKKLAFSGIMTALCVVILFMGSFFSTIDLSMSALAGILLILAVIEAGDKCAWGIFCASSVLALILIPSKLVVAFFILFMGWYPIAQRTLEKLPSFLSWCVKIAVFNLFLTAIILVANFVLRLPESDFSFSLALYAVGNVTFVIYDIAISRLITLYLIKLRKILKLNKLL